MIRKGNMGLRKIISGGQTGADRGALIAAKCCEIETGGWMPRGFLALDGSHLDYAERYGMKEAQSDDYPSRTSLNVRDSDATLRIAYDFNAPGERCTLKCIQAQHKRHLDVNPGITTPQRVADWITAEKIEVLNVAGNAERGKGKGIQNFTSDFMFDVFICLGLVEES